MIRFLDYICTLCAEHAQGENEVGRKGFRSKFRVYGELLKMEYS